MGAPRCLAFGRLGYHEPLREAPLPGRPVPPPQVVADHFHLPAHNQSMNTLSSRALPQSLVPRSLVPQSLVPQSLVPQSLVPRSLVPVFCTALSPTPPLWKSPGILRSFTRNTHRINLLPFLSVNYPVNFNPENRPLFSPKAADLGVKRPPFRSFRAPRRRPLDKC